MQVASVSPFVKKKLPLAFFVVLFHFCSSFVVSAECVCPPSLEAVLLFLAPALVCLKLSLSRLFFSSLDRRTFETSPLRSVGFFFFFSGLFSLSPPRHSQCSVYSWNTVSVDSGVRFACTWTADKDSISVITVVVDFCHAKRCRIMMPRGVRATPAISAHFPRAASCKGKFTKGCLWLGFL